MQAEEHMVKDTKIELVHKQVQTLPFPLVLPEIGEKLRFKQQESDVPYAEISNHLLL